MRLRSGCRTTKSRRSRSESAKLSGATCLPVGLHRHRRTSLFVNSSKALKIAVLFTLRESRGHRISFVACRVVALAKTGQGFAVEYYGFTLGASDLPAETGSTSSTLDFCNVRVKGPLFPFGKHFCHKGTDALKGHIERR